MSLDRAVSLRDLEPLAEAVLDPAAFAYIASGAGDEHTLRDNEAAFARRSLRPRVLVDVTAVDPATSVLGTRVPMPVGVAPTAQHGLAHPGAEAETARGAGQVGALFCLSTLSSLALEEVAAAVDGPAWFQLYTHTDPAVTDDVIERAVSAGFGALVLTVDLPVVGQRDREVRGGYVWPTEPGRFGTFARYGDGAGAGLHRSQDTWAGLARIRERSAPLPLVVKGVLTGEDAALAVEHGAAAVWVSNHGGRQLDRTPASLDVLEEVVDAVDGRAEVYLDSGVRRGTDVLAALALGARCVFVGRPVLYGLALEGASGVARVLGMLQRELVTAMTLLGTPTVADVTRAHLA